VALDHTSPEAEAESRSRLQGLVAAWRERQAQQAEQGRAAGEGALVATVTGTGGWEGALGRCGRLSQRWFFGKKEREKDEARARVTHHVALRAAPILRCCCR
jgi:hypothetical protein